MMTRVWFFNKKSSIIFYFFACHLVRVSIINRSVFGFKILPIEYMWFSLAKTESRGVKFVNFLNFGSTDTDYIFFTITLHLTSFIISLKSIPGMSSSSVSGDLSTDPERNPWAVSERISVDYSLPTGFSFFSEREFTFAYTMLSKPAVSDSLVLSEYFGKN